MGGEHQRAVRKNTSESGAQLAVVRFLCGRASDDKLRKFYQVVVVQILLSVLAVHWTIMAFVLVVLALTCSVSEVVSLSFRPVSLQKGSNIQSMQPVQFVYCSKFIKMYG